MSITLNLQVQRDAGALVLNLAPVGDNRTAAIAGQGRCTGLASLGIITTADIVGVTAGCRGSCNAAYDPNLLSEVHAIAGSDWNDGNALPVGQPSSWQSANLLIQSRLPEWNDAECLPVVSPTFWQAALSLSGSGLAAWNEGALLTGDADHSWAMAARLWNETRTAWNEGVSIQQSAVSGFRPQLPLLSPDNALAWNDGPALANGISVRTTDGLRFDSGWLTAWNDGGLAYNAWKPPTLPPEPPQPPTPPFILNLKNYRAIGPLVLNLGYSRPAWNVNDRRYYAVLNTCSVVRLPDLTELPVTAVALDCDADSWGWSVSLTLAGPDGWALCQPDMNGLPREVEITINGQVWTAMLDDPQLNRSFNSRKITAKGMSRSGWLAAPYAPASTVSYAVPRTAQQVAEEILDGTGWSIDWRLPNDPRWLIPAGSYLATGTPLERLLTLISAVKGCLYSGPASYAFIAYPRYPVLPWHLDSGLADVALPEAALLSWNQVSQDRAELNRVYVSGTTAGVLLELTRAGTAGDLQPTQPIVDALLTDSYAARARAEAELAAAGTGYEVSVETILGGTESIPLVRPGLVCEAAGIRGVVRSCSINASRNGGGLAVRQGLKLERRMN